MESEKDVLSNNSIDLNKDTLITNRDTPNWIGMLEQARATIKASLADYANFVDVHFIDGYNGEILMGGIHRDFPGKPYGGFFVINNRLSNLNHEVKHFISLWKKIDNQQYEEIYRENLRKFK